MSADSPPPPPNPWPRMVMITTIALLLILGAGWGWQKTMGMPSSLLAKGSALIRQTGHEAASVARAFHEGSVRQEFLSSAAALTGTKRLQVATLNDHEIFRRQESDSLLWGLIALPGIVVQADVPVEYTYYVDLDGPWEFRQAERTVSVSAPLIAPNTPAPDISKLVFYTLEGRVWQDDKAVRDRLQASLSGSLRERSRDHLPLVRELARRQVEQFVEKWMAATFSDGRDFRAVVVFSDEGIAPAREEKAAPAAAAK